ncbi:hypothetical protein [Pedobacter punctiformis]|uniref:Uncharacterized protein n=1 Tax=Pedobacter punctiformis TaxID=3004097 RepID=A0ABT4LAX4_9SPHI|nr:hypothetical protein [Pedobacter sp. HCMS5-2]MCZ4245077.1 hypothetical protein [Pedobacter sp. HCMS5-2]
MINKLNILLIFVVSSCIAQQKQKSDLYLYFKPDSLTYKTTQKENTDIVRKGKVFSAKYDYDIYTWQYFTEGNIRHRYRLMTINKPEFSFKDSTFVKNKAMTFAQIKSNKSIYFDSTDSKRFPFRKVFVVEYISSNKYKLVEVKTYIGSDD